MQAKVRQPYMHAHSDAALEPGLQQSGLPGRRHACEALVSRAPQRLCTRSLPNICTMKQLP